MRPLFFSSGIFFSIAMVPEKYQWILLLNPVLHFLELIRTHYFAAYQTQGGSYLYVAYWTVGLSVFSLWLYLRLKKKILTT